MNARPPVWLGPRGALAVTFVAVLAGIASIAYDWRIVAGAAAVIIVAGIAADAASIAKMPDIARIIPPHLMLARGDFCRYTIGNRNAVGLRFAIFEAPVDKLQIEIAPATGTVPAGAHTSVSLALVPRERGRTQLGSAFAWFESPLGLVRRRMWFGAPTLLRIRPDMSALRGGDLAQRTRLVDAGLRHIRRRGIGGEFESLREYAGGDAFRTIDWKATARRGKVMVAQYDVERSQQIVVAVDAGRLMTARLGDRRKLDYAVSAALSIVSLARTAADRIGLHAFAGTTLAAIAPRAGTSHSVTLTDALSDLEPRAEESDYERAALELRRRYRKRSLIVVFTDLFDPVASSVVLGSLALLAPHHLVLVVLMNDAAIGDALAAAPQTAAQAYRASVATKLAAQRAEAVARLRDRGIGIVDVPARDLTLAVLDAYVEVKRRALL